MTEKEAFKNPAEIALRPWRSRKSSEGQGDSKLDRLRRHSSVDEAQGRRRMSLPKMPSFGRAFLHRQASVVSNSDDQHYGHHMFNFTSSQLSKLTPSMRVALLLHYEEDNTPLLFIEMSSLIKNEWRESSRWIKFEEDVEGDWTRWSKPHVATLSLPSIQELRTCMQNGAFAIDVEYTTLFQIFDRITNEAIKSKIITESKKSEFLYTLSRPHEQFIKKSAKFHCKSLCTFNDDDSSSANNFDMLRRLPINIEVCNILVGEVESLKQSFSALVRLREAVVFEEISEIRAPTKIMFFLLCPKNQLEESKKLGRTFGTMLTDEVFRKIMYTTKIRDHIIDGIDEFLGHVTIIPPGAWDPSSRLEPPELMHVLEKRLHLPKYMLPHSNLSHIRLDEYTEENEHGHGHHDSTLKRTGKLFGGLIADVKRKLPWYKSDFTDAFDMQCVATIMFMYFALLAPIVTFGGLLEDATGQRMGAIENIISGAICGVVYSLFSGQPLTIIGSTGPILVFETILYDVCTNLNFEYLPFRFWVYLWTALILFIIVITDLSAWVSYITRFTEESFATLIAIIFIYEALMKMAKLRQHLDVVDYGDSPTGCQCIVNSTLDLNNVSLKECGSYKGQYIGASCHLVYDKLLMSILLMIGTFFISTKLKDLRHSCYFPSIVRKFLSNFAVMIAIVTMTSIDIYAGINTDKLYVPSDFRPTWSGRNWLIHPFGSNSVYTAILAFIPAPLVCILIFMDQQITAVIVNRKENQLKKGAGYHLDLLILTVLIVLVGCLGLPIFIAATVLSINHINSLKVESETSTPGEISIFMGVREQRVTGVITFTLIGLSIFMTEILKHIPNAVLYGVFLYMGVSTLSGIELYQRILLLFMPMKYQPDTEYIRNVPISIQAGCLVMLWVIKSIKTTSITFPLMLVIMIAIRKLMEGIFSSKHLEYLDEKMPSITICGTKKSSADQKENNDIENNRFDLPTTSKSLPQIKSPQENKAAAMWKNLAQKSRNSTGKIIDKEENVTTPTSPTKINISVVEEVEDEEGEAITFSVTKAEENKHEKIPFI